MIFQLCMWYKLWSLICWELEMEMKPGDGVCPCSSHVIFCRDDVWRWMICMLFERLPFSHTLIPCMQHQEYDTLICTLTRAIYTNYTSTINQLCCNISMISSLVLFCYVLSLNYAISTPWNLILNTQTKSISKLTPSFFFCHFGKKKISLMFFVLFTFFFLRKSNFSWVVK